MQPHVGHGRRGDNGVAPHRAEPLDMRPVSIVERDAFEVVEDVAAAHLAQAEEQLAGVIEHHARLPPRVHQLADEIGDALVAPGEHGGVLVAVDVLVFHHVLEVADHGRGAQVVVVQDDRLVHVQGDRKRRLNPLQPHRGAPEVMRSAARGRLPRLVLPAADVGQTVNNFGNPFHLLLRSLA